MQFSSEHTEVCQETGQTVCITAFAEAEAGGYGCAVGLDAITYECEQQENCSVFQHGACSLNG